MARKQSEPRLTPAQRKARDEAIARKRILSNIRRLVMVNRRTLESKISEAGQERVGPLTITAVTNAMIDEGTIVKERLAKMGDLLWLPDTDEDVLERRRTELLELLKVYRHHSSGGTNAEGVLGKAGEDMLKRAFTASPNMIRLHWGDTREFNDVVLEQPSDGLVQAARTINGRPTRDHIALVEVKNRREWRYPEDHMSWKLVRNAYKFDVVGLYFARRIPRSAFWYAFKSVGAIAVETFNQFAPPDTEAALAPVRDKAGLGYHDLYFSEAVTPYLQRQVDALPERIIAARDRMNAVRHIVEKYVEELADSNVTTRQSVYEDLHAELRAFDRPEPEDDEDDDGGEDEDFSDF